MILRPGWNLLGVAAAGVLVSAVAFYVPSTAWLLLPLLVAAASLSLFDALWLRRHQSDLVVTRDLPSLAGRDVAFDVTLRCTNMGLSRLRGSVREVAPPEALPRWWLTDFPAEGITHSAAFRQSFSIPVRGQFAFGPAWVRLVGPCRMLEGLWQATGTNAVKVFPEGLVAQDDLSQHLLAEIRDPRSPVAGQATQRRHGI